MMALLLYGTGSTQRWSGSEWMCFVLVVVSCRRHLCWPAALTLSAQFDLVTADSVSRADVIVNGLCIGVVTRRLKLPGVPALGRLVV